MRARRLQRRAAAARENAGARLFDSMVSVRDERSAGAPHLGLGLYIVRLIAEFHGGRASAANRADGDGVAVSVVLPLVRALRYGPATQALVGSLHAELIDEERVDVGLLLDPRRQRGADAVPGRGFGAQQDRDWTTTSPPAGAPSSCAIRTAPRGRRCRRW